MKSLADEDQTIARPGIVNRRQGFAALAFALLALLVASVAPGIEVAWVCALLLLTVFLFGFEVVSIDVAAATVMVLLGLSTLFAPLMGLQQGLVDNQHLFDGFASNAVMSIIAVMIIGAGLDRTGLMSRVAGFILKVGGNTEARVVPIISATVGVISSFMQNVGAAALFLPVVSRISARTGLPMSRLLMPMGFTAILGGTLTMVGSSPLILLNELIKTSNRTLPPDQQMAMFHLFDVTPIGIALILSGIAYFMLFGRYVLPKSQSESSAVGSDSMSYFHDVYGVDYAVNEVVVLPGSPIVGKQLEDVENHWRVHIIGLKPAGGSVKVGPGAVARDAELQNDMVLAIVADPHDLDRFITENDLKKRKRLRSFATALSAEKSGIAEILIAPSSRLIGKSARDIWMRKQYGLALIGLHRNGETMREGDNIRSMPLMAGDTLVVHTAWEALERIEENNDFVVITSEYPHAEKFRANKLLPATVFFAIALGMVLFTDIRLSVALLTGAIGMVLSGVLSIEEAYAAISWKTVFLLASLIPLGMAVESSGTASWIAEQVLRVVGDMPIWVVQSAVAVLATVFSLVMSNVGATVLLVPLAVNIAVGVGANPAMFALTVAIATSNSFILPTHQVNALIIGPAGYRVPDFIKAGGIMTVLFLVVMIAVMNLVF